MTYEPIADPPPFTHQRQTWHDTRELPAWGLLFEQRCGKSRVLIDTAGWLYDQGKIAGLLIIAPKEVCRTAWELEQIPRFLNVPHEIYRWRGLGTKAKEEGLRQICTKGNKLKIFVLNVEALSGTSGDKVKKLAVTFMKTHRTLLAVDESSTIKEQSSKRTQRVLSLADHAPYRRILTGTPVTQTPLDCFTQVGFLNTRVFGTNWYAFRNRYATLKDVYKKDSSGTPRRIGATVSGYRNLEELTEKLKSISTRVLRQDCFDLPPKLYYRRDFDPDPRLLTVYNQLVRREIAELLAQGIVTPTLAMGKTMAQRQLSSGFLVQRDEVTGEETKLEFENERLKALLKAREGCDGKTIVWTVFRHSQTAIERAFSEAGRAAVYLYGDTPDAQRLEAVARFRADVDTIVVNQRIGQFGLDLSVADWVINYEHDWSVERRIQSEDRAIHPAKRTSVGYVDLVMPGSIDEMMLKVVRDGIKLADEIAGQGWRNLFKEIIHD